MSAESAPDLEALDPNDALAMLVWQVELGADEAILDVPVDRFELPAASPKAKPADKPTEKAAKDVPSLLTSDPVAEARALASEAADLDQLREAMAGYDHCELKKGARNLVFSDGRAGARVMVVGEAPGREEDRVGKPFVGAAGQLLDAMFRAIGLSRESPDLESALYITNILPWRPPQNRDPSADEMAMMMPFVERHIALAKPEVLVVMGNIPAGALLGRRGITKLRGNWTETKGLPCLPMFHPAYLLRQPMQKRAAWSDLQDLHAKLNS